MDWVYLEVNPAFERLTGLSDVVGRRVSEVLPNLRQQNPELFAAYGRVVDSGEPARLDTFVPELGIWFSISAFRPEPGCFVAVFQNVTDRVRAERGWRESERSMRSTRHSLALAEREARESMARYAAVVDTSIDALFVNREDRVVLVNPACLRLFGAERADQLLGRSPFELIHPEFHAPVRERIRRMLETSQPAPPAEQRIVRLDGTVVDVEVAAAPFFDQGRPAVHVTMRDISERKRAEAQLRHQEAMLREAGEVAHVGGWEFDPATGEGSWTAESARIHDCDPAAPVNAKLGLTFYRGESRARIEAAVAAAIGDGTPYDLELELISAQGIAKRVRTICHPEVRDGCVVRVRGSIQDVTARVAAEEALAAERWRLRTLLDTIPDLVWLKDPEGVFLDSNPAFDRFMGVKEGKIAGRTDYDFVDRELADSFRFHDRQAIAAGVPSVNEEWVTYAADGTRGLLETIKTPMRDPNGRVLGVLGVARDVTEVRATAEALRQSEERLRLFIEHAPVALAMFDRDMRYVSASRRWRSDYGIGEGEPLLGRSHYDVFPEIGDEWKALHRRALAGEVVRSDEDRFERADGSVQWLRWELRPWRDGSGEVAGIVIFSQDITERKRNVEQLAESEAHFRALTETTFDWIWEVDAEGRYTFVSPRVRQLLGYEPEEVIGRTPFSLMPAEEAERVRGAFEAVAAQRQPFAALLNVNRHKSGRLVVLESSGVPFFGPAGEFRGYRGMDRDVTGRVVAERRSKIQAEVSRVLAESASLAEAAPRVLAAIGRAEGWQFGTLWALDGGHGGLRCVEHWATEAIDAGALARQTRELSLAPGQGFPGAVRARGKTCFLRDFAADASFHRREVAAAIGLHSAIGFPVQLGDEVIGVVELLGPAMNEPEPGLIEVFDSIGRLLGLFVERRRAEETVQRFVSGSPAVIYALRVDPEGLKLVWHGGNLERMTGWSAGEASHLGWWMDHLHPDDRERVRAAHAVPYESDHQVIEFRVRRCDGGYVWVRDEKRLLRDAEGRPTEVVGSWTDVTARVQLEEQLRVAHKLEAIGRLAGGVAHDFNNILTVISGNGELLSRALPPDASGRLLLGEIREAAERAAALTRQLLAFSRTQVLAPRVIAVSTVVKRVEAMLRRLIGEDVTLVCQLSPAAGHVLADPGQLEQVIVNLAVNARDAMPRGGRLSLTSDAVDLDAEQCRRHADIAPGRYARLVVRDTGCGMSAAVRKHVFEPFFTTKAQGTGTGLGLATVFGIVKQSEGHIEVASEEGAGAAFTIYLPQVAPPAQQEGQPMAAAPEARGRETVLLVEDESGVRRVARIALESRGYGVLAATNGREALAIAEERGDAIDLLVTDLVMPDMSGRELADVLRARHPRLAVLLMSGYVDDALVRHGVVAAEVAFLQKPFSLAGLAAKVREVLDAAFLEAHGEEVMGPGRGGGSTSGS